MVKLWIDDPKVLLDNKSWNPLEGSTEEKINVITKYIVIYGTYNAIIKKDSKKLTNAVIYVGIAMLLYILLFKKDSEDFKNTPFDPSPPQFVDDELDTKQYNNRIYKDCNQAFYNHGNQIRQFYNIPSDTNNFAKELYSEGLSHSRKEGGLYSHLGLPVSSHSLKEGACMLCGPSSSGSFGTAGTGNP
jgi:hypothetical protein